MIRALRGKWWECVNKARSTTGCAEEGRGAAALHWVKPLVCGNQKGLLSMGGNTSGGILVLQAIR